MESTSSHIAHYSTEGEYLGQVGTPGKGEGQINSPRGAAFDAEGNLLVADQGNSRIVRLSPEGEFLDEFGAKGEGDGQLKNASGVTVDPAGDIWVADTANNRIQRFDAEGKFLAKYGSAGAGNGKFQSPFGIAADSHGTIWVVDSSNHRVQALNSQGEYLTQLGKKGSGNGELDDPKGLALDAGGDIWVADRDNDRIQEWGLIYPGMPKATTGVTSEVKTTSAHLYGKVNPEGNATYRFEYGTTSAYGASVPVPGEALGPAGGDVSVSNTIKGLSPVTTYHYRLVAESDVGTAYGEDKTFTTSADDRFAYSFGEAGAGNGQLGKGANGIATAGAYSDIWVVDTENNRIEKFGYEYPYGKYLSQLGSYGAGTGQLKEPNSIAIDSSGNLWVTDSGNNRVQKFNSSFTYQTQFGSKEGKAASGNGEFNSPTGIVLDAGGKVWVTDTANDRVQRFSSSGEYLEKFGAQGSGPGQLDGPTGISIPASSWGLRFVDAANNRVQQWDMKPDPPLATTEAATKSKPPRPP